MRNIYPKGVPQIMKNPEGFYPGNLLYYYNVLLRKATNLSHLYHGLTHINRVIWFCWLGAQYYYERGQISLQEIRELIIAALFHDFNHSPKTGNDKPEIEAAIAALREYIHPDDRESLPRIEKLIWATFFTYPPVPLVNPSISELIIKDSDISQTLDTTWMQMTLVGLAGEMEITMDEMLRRQPGFFEKIFQLHTDWAQGLFPPSDIKQRLEQVSLLQEILALG